MHTCPLVPTPYLGENADTLHAHAAAVVQPGAGDQQTVISAHSGIGPPTPAGQGGNSSSATGGGGGGGGGGAAASAEPSSSLEQLFRRSRDVQPEYFQRVDVVALPSFLLREECGKIVEFAEEQGFNVQRRHRLQNLLWTDIVDPLFAKALWHKCGLEAFFRPVMVDGTVATGLNEVIRIQKYETGCLMDRHIDQPVRLRDGQSSRYTLKVFLNEQGEAFDGGFTVFHLPYRTEPFRLKPEIGVGLLYPQGELCPTQQEAEVIDGCKYVLRADVLFKKPTITLPS